MKKELESS